MSLVATLPERKKAVEIEQALLGVPVSRELIDALLFLMDLYRAGGYVGIRVVPAGQGYIYENASAKVGGDVLPGAEVYRIEPPALEADFKARLGQHVACIGRLLDEWTPTLMTLLMESARQYVHAKLDKKKLIEIIEEMQVHGDWPDIAEHMTAMHVFRDAGDTAAFASALEQYVNDYLKHGRAARARLGLDS